MKDTRFYEEFTNTTKKTSQRNVVAAFVGNGTYSGANGSPCYDAISGVFSYPDSPVASGGVSLDYLRLRCKRISEKRAREIHPALFKRLDEE